MVRLPVAPKVTSPKMLVVKSLSIVMPLVSVPPVKFNVSVEVSDGQEVDCLITPLRLSALAVKVALSSIYIEAVVTVASSSMSTFPSMTAGPLVKVMFLLKVPSRKKILPSGEVMSLNKFGALM